VSAASDDATGIYREIEVNLASFKAHPGALAACCTLKTAVGYELTLS